MNNYLTIKRQGKFYVVFNEDAYILHVLLGYKVSKNRTGFPTTSLNKVVNLLEKKKINYIIIDKPEEVVKRNFPNNKYSKYVEDCKKAYEKFKSNEELVNKIKNLSREQVDLIVDFIKDVVYE